ncbi:MULTISPECIES: glycosyltransferase family 4 protein [Dyella]|uniref:Glycosyltransferase n=2 Tax=Dyella TaxID=231454 RepID=A0A4R0YUI5_9GAMM|nr:MULTISPECIES: glycosyltransferase family 4 protein [Dyella]TBR39463.1 glycosyltransferase [Dyella terrae]TCI12952.1 glycosyltransferase [Dyella soli]
MHVVQINFEEAPADMPPGVLFDRWHSVADIPETAASVGVRMSVVQHARYTGSLRRNGVDYHFLDVGEVPHPGSRGQRSVRRVQELRPDVVHVHGLRFAAEAYALQQGLPGVPILIQDHADRPPRWWRRARWKHWYSVISGVAFTTRALAQPYLDAGMFGPRMQLFDIPESTCHFRVGSQLRARARTGLHGSPCVLWVGRLSSGKDPLTVLDGISRAMSVLPGLEMWCLYGDATLLEQVRKRIDSDSRLAGRVHLRGKVPHADVEAYLRSADIFVSGSHAEGSGYALLEAMACGAMPVVTDIPAHRALAAPVARLWPRGDAVAMGDALIEAARGRFDRASVRAHFDRFLSRQAVGKLWADAYEQLLATHWRRTG